MEKHSIPEEVRKEDYYYHIDMGFLNRRLAISALGPIRDKFFELQTPGDDHMTRLRNDHLLVTMLLDLCVEMNVPTLSDAIKAGKDRCLFKSIERLEACPEIYEEERVSQKIRFDFEPENDVFLEYHTSHLVADTGKMTLSEGADAGYREAIVGLLHRKNDKLTIEPIVIGAPFLDHPRNSSGVDLAWFSSEYGELTPEDIEEFSKMKAIKADTPEEWMEVMKEIPEKFVKEAIAKLLNEPAKPDWGGEENDHFSSNCTVAGRKHTASFLLKGPAKFKEMSPAMCGKNADQIYRLSNSGADISIIQHCHLVGSAVRETIRAFTVTPGRPRKFCILDGQATYRLLKAYGFLNEIGGEVSK